ncbi:MAG: glycoside hydrolase family 15 protein [Beijerinckiaceae bacterium]|nr:glycoside hydrolase family 15 protein [Beijerinckiaceae bacterium]
MAAAVASAGSVPALDGDQVLREWMPRQYEASAASMLRAISAAHLVKERPGFGQTIRPARGSILASAAIGSWDPDPDYFFHWLRDSAVVIDALRHLIGTASHGAAAISHCSDFVAFSLALNRLDGASFLRRSGDFRKNVDYGFLQFVREDSEILAIAGDRVLGEPRFNPDATLDISKWSRPQHDGPALRALALMRWPLDLFDDAARASLRALILTDLSFVRRNWREPSFDVWEEELGEHYYTRLLHHAALADGAHWIEKAAGDEAGQAQECRSAAQEIIKSLDEFWSPVSGHYVSRRAVINGVSGKDLDISVLLAVIHAARNSGAHSVFDPKVMATVARLENLFDLAYPINHGRSENLGPAMGRYAGDNYYSGGAYYFSTLGAAEFYYSLAEGIAAGTELPVTADNREFLFRLEKKSDVPVLSPRKHREGVYEALLGRGDQFMRTVAAFTPASGELSEQFDQKTGARSSAKILTWSHAAFITAAARRKAALGNAGQKLSLSVAPP